MPIQRVLSRKFSAMSLDINDLIACTAQEESSLLSEATSSDLSSVDSSGFLNDVPPFPSERHLTQTISIGLRYQLPLFPGGSSASHTSDEDDGSSPVLIAAPTMPRLKTTLKETLCVQKWAESIVAADAPGHTAWHEDQILLPMVWIPGGSIFPPEMFKAMRTRNPPVRKAKSAVRPGRPASKDPDTTCPRDDLVFKREITLDSNGEKRRYSVQVPASTMPPDMVNMMLELQTLRSYFKEGRKGDFQPPFKTSRPPKLTVSNSNLTLPISLESVKTEAAEAPVVLAARRGKRVPPPLALNTSTSKEELYPGIPSAYLGSPSHPPQFEYSNFSNSPSMDLETMVTSLRSQSASLGCMSPTVCQHEDQSVERPSQISSFPVRNPSEAGGGDEWAFADSFMPKDSDVGLKPLLKISSNHSPQPDRRASVPVIAMNTPENRDSRPIVSIHRKIDTPGSAHPAQRQPDIPVGPPPSTPLPQRPIRANLPPVKQPRSILKSTKSVRFASLPDDEGETDEKTPVRVTLKLAARPRASLQQSPLLNKIVPKEAKRGMMTPSKPTTPGVTRRSLGPGTLAPPTLQTPTIVKNRRATVSSPLRVTTTAFQSHLAGDLAYKDTTKALKSRSFTASLGRRSLGGIEKENDKSRWSTIDENALRRANGSSVQKGKIPVPLRNIFTRFK